MNPLGPGPGLIELGLANIQNSSKPSASIMAFSPNLRGIICMVLACLFFVCCDSFLKLMLLEGIPPLQTLWLRGVFATVSCLVLVVVLGLGWQIPRAFEFWTLARAMCEVVSVTAFIFALGKVPYANVTAIYQIAPLVVLAGASVLWHEKVGGLRWALIALGCAGAIVVAQPGTAGASPYALLCLITAFGSAARDLLSRHVPDDVPGPIITLTIVILVALNGLAGSLLFETWQPIAPQVWGYAVGAGTFVMVAHLMIFLAFRYARARAVTPFYYTLTVFAVIFGAAFFNEIPNTLAIIGILMIMGCGLAVLAMEGSKA
jgi:drug/metabolite transporter (DMT)-like permease